MPIYAYKCESCGHALDVLQKMSDAPLTDCPSCGSATLAKQVTAAGFQLKGSGWYVTDFKSGGATSTPPPKVDDGKPAAAEPAAAKAADAPAAAPAAAPAPAPAASSGTGSGS
jgi:putative FmdB family regulatory protein